MLVRLSAAWARSLEGGGSSLARPLARLSREARALLSVFFGRQRLVFVSCDPELEVDCLEGRGLDCLAWLGVPGPLPVSRRM